MDKFQSETGGNKKNKKSTCQTCCRMHKGGPFVITDDEEQKTLKQISFLRRAQNILTALKSSGLPAK